MPVAKSYQSMRQLGDPFANNGRLYVKVETSTGAVKTVRWYNDAEYARLYPEHTALKQIKPTKEILGFTNGYITIFKGDSIPDLEGWFAHSPCRYHSIWGWYLPSTEQLPSPLPLGITPLTLTWESISRNEELRPVPEIQKAIDSLLYEPSASQYRGSIGDKLDWFTAILTDDRTFDTQYGLTHYYTFKDTNDNVYTWKTNAATLKTGTTYSLKGTIKDHQTYKNVKQTVLTRCRVTTYSSLPSI